MGAADREEVQALNLVVDRGLVLGRQGGDEVIDWLRTVAGAIEDRPERCVRRYTCAFDLQPPAGMVTRGGLRQRRAVRGIRILTEILGGTWGGIAPKTGCPAHSDGLSMHARDTRCGPYEPYTPICCARQGRIDSLPVASANLHPWGRGFESLIAHHAS